MHVTDPIYRSIIDSNSAAVRQDIIKRIQQEIKTKLIVYTASPQHPIPTIMHHDVPLFEDLLRSVGDSSQGCLMINSPGGDPNAAEKLLMMCRQRFTKEFDVIVPDYAKSAATMIALGSDKIMMGYLAELGPIDPQLQTSPIPGGETIPARSFIDGLDMIRRKVKEDKDPVAMYLPMLQQIRPEVLAMCQRAIDDAKLFAEKWLKSCMLKEDTKQAEAVAEMLSTGAAYKSHGKVIDFKEAKDVLKLNAEMIDEKSSLWSNIWELYCRSVHQLQQSPMAAKLFESESISLTLNIQVQMIQMPKQPAPAAPVPRQPPPNAQPVTPPVTPPDKKE
jgi:ClpP class serine protease